MVHIVDGRAGTPDGADDVVNAEFFRFADYTVPFANIVNHPPVVMASDRSATRGQVIAGSSLFTWVDADNDSLLFGLRDNTGDPSSGHFEVRGVVEPANQTFVLTAAVAAPGSEDTELGVILEPEVVYGTQTLWTRIQA